jgi:hypothetical protein
LLALPPWLCKHFHGGDRSIDAAALFPQLGQDLFHTHAPLLTGERAIVYHANKASLQIERLLFGFQNNNRQVRCPDDREIIPARPACRPGR